MKSRLKIGLSALVPIATIGAVAPLVTSCSKSIDIVNRVHRSNIDAQFGLNANTYKQLKKDYKSKLTNSMISQGIQKDSKLWNSKMSQLQTAFNAFDNKANTTSMSYATLTSSLMNYARVTDKLQLRRVTNTKWSTVNALFQGAYDSFDLFMTHEHFSEARKTKILNDATAQFNAKLAELESEGYKENDPFGAVQEIRMNLTNFFDGVNDQICYLSSLQRLNDFNSKYAIEYKTLVDSSSYKSVWPEVSENIGKIISEGLFNKLFKIVDYSTGNIVQFQPALLIPGYTLRPKLVSCSADEKANEFKIEIDLGLIKTSYLNSNDEAAINKMTVHTVKLDKNLGIADETGEINKAITQNKNLSNDKDFFDFASKLPIQTQSFNLWNQLNEENNAIKDIYFNTSKSEYIRFRWPEASSQDACFDPFINKIPFESETKKAYVNFAELSRAGLEISQDGKNWYPVWKLLISGVNKITQNVLNCCKGDECQVKNSLMEDFILNCDILSVAEYVESGSSYEIKHKFNVTFKQSSSLKPLEDIYVIEDQFIKGKCENYKISQHEFIEVSTKYSRINELVAQFNKNNNVVEKIGRLITGWKVIFGIMIATIAALMTGIGAVTKLHIKFLSNDFAVLVGGGVALASCITSEIILKKMCRKVNDFKERAAEVNNAAATINLINVLKECTNTFVEVDEHGNYDKNDANVKNSKFQEKPFKEQWKTVSYLTTLFEQGHNGYEFKQLVTDKKVGPEEARDLSEMFSPSNGEFIALIANTVGAIAAIYALAKALYKDFRKNKIKPLLEEAKQEGVDIDGEDVEVEWEDGEAKDLDQIIKKQDLQIQTDKSVVVDVQIETDPVVLQEKQVEAFKILQKKSPEVQEVVQQCELQIKGTKKAEEELRKKIEDELLQKEFQKMTDDQILRLSDEINDTVSQKIRVQVDMLKQQTPDKLVSSTFQDSMYGNASRQMKLWDKVEEEFCFQEYNWKWNNEQKTKWFRAMRGDSSTFTEHITNLKASRQVIKMNFSTNQKVHIYGTLDKAYSIGGVLKWWNESVTKLGEQYFNIWAPNFDWKQLLYIHLPL